jgi:branched-chain amino acid transport system substrate-binding protein
MEADAGAVVKEAGGKVVGGVRHPLNASDFSSFLLQAQASKARIIGLANAGGDTINAVKAAAEFGVSRSQTLAPLLLFINDVHAMGLETARGMLLTEAFYWDLDDKTRAWSARYAERLKGAKKMPNMIHAGVYSAVTHYLGAVMAEGSDEAGKVMQRMRATPVNDVFARNGKLREDGRMVHDMYLMQVKTPAESKGAWDYYNVKAVISGDDAFQPLSRSRCNLISAK